MTSTASSHHTQAPRGVQTHAQSAMQLYPELVVPGFEKSSQVFALVAESLGQKPSVKRIGSISQHTSSTATKRAAITRHSEATYQPQGLSGQEKRAQKPPARKTEGVESGAGKKTSTVRKAESGMSRIDAKTAERRRKEWIRRLKAVFDFEVTPSSNASTTGESGQNLAPTHFYIDLYSTGSISLQPPAVMQHHGDAADAAAWARRNVVKLTISDRDLLAVAIGERVPIKLFSVGRLRIKGDIHKALLLGKLLSVTRSQIYADADAESPSHDLYDARLVSKGPLSCQSPHDKSALARVKANEKDSLPAGGDWDAQGMQGQGAVAGSPEWGTRRMGSHPAVRSKL